jgi:hypothetical protein
VELKARTEHKVERRPGTARIEYGHARPLAWSPSIPAHLLDPQTVLSLQRDAGNASVAGLFLQRAPAAGAPPAHLTAAQIGAAQAQCADLSDDSLKQLRKALGLDEAGGYDDDAAQAVYTQQRTWHRITNPPGVADYDFFGRLGLVRVRKVSAAIVTEGLEVKKSIASQLAAEHPDGVPVVVYSNYDIHPITPTMTAAQKAHWKEMNAGSREFEYQANIYAAGQGTMGLAGSALFPGLAIDIRSAGEVVEKLQTVHLGLVNLWKETEGAPAPGAQPPTWTQIGSLATFCHGHPKHQALDLSHSPEAGYWSEGVHSIDQSNDPDAFKANVESFVQGLSGAISPNIKVLMFSCSVAGSPDFEHYAKPAGPEAIVRNAGEDAYAAAITAGKSKADARKDQRQAEAKARRTAMAVAEKNAAEELPKQEATGEDSLADAIQVEIASQLGGSPSAYGHLTAAHTTRNPAAMVFGADSGGGPGGRHIFDLIYDHDYMDKEMDALFPTLKGADAAKTTPVRKRLKIRTYVHFYDQITNPTDKGPKGHEKQPIAQEMFADLPTAKVRLQADMTEWLDLNTSDIGPRPGDFPTVPAGTGSRQPAFAYG